MTPPAPATVRRATLLLAACAFAWTLIVAFTGGFTAHVSFLRLSSRDALRPFLAGLALSLWYLAVWRLHWDDDAGRLTRLNAASMLAGLLALLAFLIGVHWGTFMGSGPDASGYVSQADMWAHGRMSMPLPGWVRDPAWPIGPQPAAPVGWTPRAASPVMVPVYSAGLPLILAMFQLAGGPGAMFYVVPLFGALAVWVLYLLGREISGPWAGIISATLLLFSPPFLLFLIQPMSDVPVTACFALALAWAWRGDTPHAAWAGIAMGLGLLIRPNLAPLALLSAVLGAMSGDFRLRRIALFAAPVTIAAAITAGVNWYWHGSPFTSGYGSLGSLYAFDRTWPNFVRYASWLIATQTPLVLLGLMAPLVLTRARHDRRRLLLVTAVYPLTVLAMYLAYLTFDHWAYLRFLLPALPALFAGLGALLSEYPVTAARRGIVSAGAVAVVALIAIHEWQYASRHDVFSYAAYDSRFAKAVSFAAALPAGAVLVSNVYSGTLGFYARRDVLRWEALGPREIDLSLAFLRQQKHPLYLVGDTVEVAQFRRYFEGSRTVAQLERRLVRDPGDFAFADLSGEP